MQNKSKGHQIIAEWFSGRNWQPFDYQTESWQAVLDGKNGLLNAPTGSGKTFALLMPALIRWIDQNPKSYKELADNGLQLLWITPLRALAKDLEQAMQQVVDELAIPWQAARRTGDVSSYQKQQLKKQMPEVLITTPESMHIMMAQKNYPRYFKDLEMAVVDEWHELLGSKRGTQAELALSRLRGLKDDLQVWGISATIGNMQQAKEVLLGPDLIATDKPDFKITDISSSMWIPGKTSFAMPPHSASPRIDPIFNGEDTAQTDLMLSKKASLESASAGLRTGAHPNRRRNRNMNGCRKTAVIKADIKKKLMVKSVLPDNVENFPWSGHLGTRLLPKVIPILEDSRSTLIFTNTRSQSEVWFQQLLEAKPGWAGNIALHHGSLSAKIRNWVEQSLHEGSLKAVVCTSSLDLGVDFAPVETVVQVGSPKGVARFMQRAGRSGHQPGATSRIFFVPTNALELIEAAALKTAALSAGSPSGSAIGLESRQPVLKPYDVLIQYLVTLGVSDGFDSDQIFRELKKTFAYQTLNEREWNWILNFLTTGGESLTRYDEYSKIHTEDGLLKVTDRKIKRRHRMSIGTIASDTMMSVKYLKGAHLGSIEEWFVTSLSKGDTFWFAGRSLELVRIKDMTAYVRRGNTTKAKVPSWMGGRMSLSSNMSLLLRRKLHEAVEGTADDEELRSIQPILDIQGDWSALPDDDELLIEKMTSREGCHLFVYPFEGRCVHEGMSALIAWRISQMLPITFSIAMNDYGFELLSDKDIPIEKALETDLFTDKNLVKDIFSSLNDTVMAKHRFREICQISGLIFQGFPGQKKANRHLQMSSGLFFDVFAEHEPDNLLLQQAYDELLAYQLDETRLRKALQTIQTQRITLRKPERFTPLAFPIMVDRLRGRLSSEKLIDRVQRMQVQLGKHV